MMNERNSSKWRGLILAPLMLLCLVLLVNGCTRKKISTETPEDGLEELQQEETQEQDETEEAIDEDDGQDEQEKEVKKRKKKKRKKIPATQRPYVIEGETYYPISSAQGYEETGVASWYGDPFHGRKTANGETYDMYGETAAHKTLPMDTLLLVKNLVNGKTATVRINDRGPFVDGRIIDLSYTTAKELGIVRRGTGKVQIIALCAAEEVSSDEKEAVAEQERNTEEVEKIEEEGGIPVLIAQGKKKTSKKKEAKGPERVTGLMCVIHPNGKKQRIQQDFDKGNFYIQVGSFEEREKARELARTFASQGDNVLIQEFAAAGGSLFRVLVYSSTSLKEAKKHKEKLVKQGYEHAFVIARDDPPKKRAASKKEKKELRKVAKS
ncbi:MAG: septal ring lytic transglycosylase RlpA family protein [Candidatus Electrothrix aestuarii]|uniref:Probable endolytic peptidoglycan transglycosylase RlpA n=1 Tax=Candidatus Electrothrix aestuarii TaxID=3062594 RepID=A0AAU8LTV8_9BACT|nr:septal ring lytic transglycosylase RlpA family protein [Candidatus Electrothrix aestuarii]